MSAALFEEHSSVLAHWHGLGVRQATVVYLDAHLDLQFVDPGRIDKLRGCRDAPEMCALEAVHPYASQENACYGIEDFLFPAVKLGLVERIVWVAPPHVLRVGIGRSLGKLVQIEGVTLEEVESFDVRPGGWASGRLMGVELVVCSLEQLAAVSLPPRWLLDIDVDYFVNLPDERLGVDPCVAIERLQSLASPAEHVTVSLSIGTGFTPPHFRAVGETLVRAWGGECDGAPGAADGHAIASEIAAVWSRRLPLDNATILGWQHALLQGGEASSSSAGAAWVMLGLIQSAAGLTAAARESDDFAGRLGVRHPELALSIAQAHLERGDAATARHYLARAVTHGSTRARAYLLSARAELADGGTGPTNRWLDQAIASLPANPEPLDTAAALARSAGDARQANELEQRARAIGARLSRVASRLAGAGGAPPAEPR